LALGVNARASAGGRARRRERDAFKRAPFGM
jgi:hypothetical protein